MPIEVWTSPVDLHHLTSKEAPLRHTRVWRAGTTKLLGLALLIIGFCAVFSGAKGEDGCPEGRFPSVPGVGCAGTHEANRLPLDDEQPMQFQAVQISMMQIRIYAVGTITEDTPREFKKFLASSESEYSRDLFIHSNGGNLAAGLEFGRLIRKARLNTHVGRAVMLDGGVMDVHQYKLAVCASACGYAFLGGVSRTFDDGDIFGLHRFGSKDRVVTSDVAQIMTSRIAAYVEEMGVSQAVLQVASSAGFEDDLHRVSVASAKRMRIIFDPSGRTSFRAEYKHGRAVVAFEFPWRENVFSATISCADVPRLTIADPSGQAFQAFSAMVGYPAAFLSNGSKLQGTASYQAGEQGGGTTPSLVFAIPGLTEHAFAGSGLEIHMIWNPAIEARQAADPTKNVAALVEKLNWVALVQSVGFQLVADNSTSTLPLVLRECGKSAAPSASENWEFVPLRGKAQLRFEQQTRLGPNRLAFSCSRGGVAVLVSVPHSRGTSASAAGVRVGIEANADLAGVKVLSPPEASSESLDAAIWLPPGAFRALLRANVLSARIGDIGFSTSTSRAAQKLALIEKECLR